MFFHTLLHSGRVYDSSSKSDEIAIPTSKECHILLRTPSSFTQYSVFKSV